MSQEELLKDFFKRIATLITEASHVLNGEKLAELLVFMSEGAEMNLAVLSVPEEYIASAREIYREAATIAIDKTAIEIIERALKDN